MHGVALLIPHSLPVEKVLNAMSNPSLFSPIKAGDLELSNRIAMAPLTRNRSPNAIPKDITTTYYEQRASAGLLITEGTAIDHQAQGYADVPGLYGSDQLDGWKKVTKAVHKRGGKIVTQIWHVGRISHVDLQPDFQAPVSASAIAANTKTYLVDHATGNGHFVPTSVPRELKAQEIPGIVHAYVLAARNAVSSAGFDGVEIHAANGYLLEQFLKNGANKRTDDYGGSIENRARLLLEVTRAVVDAIGGGKVGIRLSPVTPANDIIDSHPQPLYDYVAEQLAPLGLAFVHVVEGATGGPREVEGRPFDYADFKNNYRKFGGKGAWMVNNGYDKALAEKAIESGHADMVAFGKAFISNPDLVERLKADAPLNAWDQSTFYGGGEKGYTDYPAMG